MDVKSVGLSFRVSVMVIKRVSLKGLRVDAQRKTQALGRRGKVS